MSNGSFHKNFVAFLKSRELNEIGIWSIKSKDESIGSKAWIGNI